MHECTIAEDYIHTLNALMCNLLEGNIAANMSCVINFNKCSTLVLLSRYKSKMMCLTVLTPAEDDVVVNAGFL